MRYRPLASCGSFNTRFNVNGGEPEVASRLLRTADKEDLMIIEGIVTSQNCAGELNVAPMGPIVDESMTTLLLRPFQTSRTYRNLKEHRAGVFHVVDDVLLLAQAAIGRLTELPATTSAEHIVGQVLLDACRWYEFEVTALDDSNERTHIETRVVHVGRRRDVFGFNRAKHAVLEAAILATRLHILPSEVVRQQWEWLRSPVQKTAGPRELMAFTLLDEYVSDYLKSAPTVISECSTSCE